MSTELERLKAWMAKHGYDAESLQKALGARFSLHYLLNGTSRFGLEIHNSLRSQFFDTFGFDAYAEVFDTGFLAYQPQYAAQTAVQAAKLRGDILPASAHKCYGCDNQADDYHHESYAKEDRLCVVPLCHKCHRNHHSGRKPLTFGVVPTAVGLIRIAISPAPQPANVS